MWTLFRSLRGAVSFPRITRRKIMAKFGSAAGKSPNDMFDNSGNGVIAVPGYGWEISQGLDPESSFRHGLMDAVYERLTVREVAMLGLMDALTDKPNWQEKIQDESIVQKWREEALSMPLISEKTFEWCLTELRDKAAIKQTNYIRTLDSSSRCVKTDSVISSALQSQLRTLVQPLLDGPRDWHPGSGDKVLNLVHPSLYPLVYGKTRVLETGQTSLTDVLAAPENTVIPPADQDFEGGIIDGDRMMADEAQRWSKRFQWLPCEVAFQNDSGTEVKITSYINNLHPKEHSELYSTIEKIIQHAIPAWNDVLLIGSAGRTPLRITTMSAELDPPELPDWIEKLAWQDVDENWAEDAKKVKEYLKVPDEPSMGIERQEDSNLPPENFEDGHDENWAPKFVAEWKFRRTQKVIHPEPGTPHTFDDWKHGRERHFAVAGSGYSGADGKRSAHEFYDVNLEKEFRDAGLQVIVKLASVELTPENPQYTGGNWHVEGMLNEHIVATAIYYYDVDNITQARIRFRQEAELDDYEMSYEQDQHWPISEVFGTKSLRDEPAVQELGSIATPDGRLLVFPNTLQHKVEPFELADPSRPGHRRFLVLWLVDPHYRIMSTRNVPPQQHDWWVEKAKKTTNLSARVPREVQMMIEEQMKTGTMTLDEAKNYRLELMAERTGLQNSVETAINTYNFCEH